MTPALLFACAGNAPEPAPACNLERGKALYAQCAICHGPLAGPVNIAAPNLKGVVGRPIGHVKEFRYSPAFRKAQGVWTPQRLDAYLENPMTAIPNSRMAFAGMPNAADRADVICYLEHN